ncbi:LPS-assembly protein LptD [Undibacterium sp.]|jgi:LPS-assembly protein|uniref:LPS-assembly protein LptD n=1 Tax=Undibacterium sp. TaxID=1914977 RepID=UPI002B7B83D1|nr:LPS-assembly protein LptD [Undibacterium sp.]HTD05745.1 LPS-assembly protein LptD [Undibacterium sp.]
MRWKPVLSHSQQLFPTFSAIVVAAIVPAIPAQAQTAIAEQPAAAPSSALPAEVKAKDAAAVQEVRLVRGNKADDKAGNKDAPTVIQSESMSGRPERIANFDNDVEIVKGGMTLNADRATYRNLEDEVDASGNLRLQRFGDCYSGDTMRLQMDTGIGYIENPVYKLVKNNAQGHASRVDFLSEEHSVIHSGTYSTCQGLSPDWYLRADTLSLDTGLDSGIARNATVYFKDVPILVAPRLSFPLSGARQSGLLPPIFGASSTGGVEFGLPYYYSIAPNRDLTFYPKLIARRGLQMGLEGRYLGETYSGETSVEGLLDDRQTKTNRWSIASIHKQKLLPNLDFSWDVNAASDDNYPSDFSRSITKTAQRLLLREADMVYYGSFWNLGLRASNYQVLQDLAAPITRPYDRLPQLTFHAEKRDLLGFDAVLDASLTRFWHPTMVRGDRAVLNPQLSYPIINPGWFITPKISLHATTYQLNNTGVGQPADLNRVLPTFSLDSGMVFEKKTKFFGEEITQTLEPRLFYVKTPYRNQDLFPNFDSATADFNFAQIFSENRFTGSDRIGDSNQITAALVSRYIEASGEERLRLAIGQRFYFNTQLVTLPDVAATQSRSDLLLSADGKVSKTLSASAELQFSQTDRQTVRANYGIRWQPESGKVLNVEYRQQKGVLEQFDVSGQWPLARRWYAVARSNYSLLDKQLVEGVAGLEYRADCWSFRFIAQRFATATLQSTSAFSFQLELNGLGRFGLGSNPIEVLKKNISGYQSGD